MVVRVLGRGDPSPQQHSVLRAPVPARAQNNSVQGKSLGDRGVGSRGEEGQAGPGAWPTGCGTRRGGGCLSSLA